MPLVFFAADAEAIGCGSGSGSGGGKICQTESNLPVSGKNGVAYQYRLDPFPLWLSGP